jgi:hypothetical protein
MRRISHVRGLFMAAPTPKTLPPTAKNRLATAVDQARHGRHHPDCRCGRYKGIYCTEIEWSWSQKVDRLITTVCRETVE